MQRGGAKSNTRKAKTMGARSRHPRPNRPANGSCLLSKPQKITHRQKPELPTGFGTVCAPLNLLSGTSVPDTHCPKTQSLQGGASDFLLAVRSLAPDPHVHGRTLLPSQRPHFFCCCLAAQPPTLDGGPHSALFLRDSGCSAPCVRQPDRRQRSFNWQSTAFVMRGLWVRFPPLAFGVRCAILTLHSSLFTEGPYE